jgi:hypothetical protein
MKRVAQQALQDSEKIDTGFDVLIQAWGVLRSCTRPRLCSDKPNLLV